MTALSVLGVFADHCDRMGLAHRPRVFAHYLDIWGESRGDIGIPDPDDLDRASYAVLVPWAMIPTLGQARLVVDMLDYLVVVGLKVNARGMFNPYWTIEYGMDDDGSLRFGDQIEMPIPPGIALSVEAAKSARAHQAFWDRGHTIESTVPVVMGLLGEPR